MSRTFLKYLGRGDGLAEYLHHLGHKLLNLFKICHIIVRLRAICGLSRHLGYSLQLYLNKKHFVQFGRFHLYAL